MTPQERLTSHLVDIAAGRTTTGAADPLTGLFIIDTTDVPKGSWGFAVGRTLYIHPADVVLLKARVLAGQEARKIVRRGLEPVLAWLHGCGVKA